MISYDDEGRLLIDDTRVYAALSGGKLSVMVRATDRATFFAVAEQVGLVEADEDGNVAPIRDVTITELGPYVITPATFDEDGNELTPAVLDNRYHVNFWLGPTVVERNQWQAWLLQWMENGEAAQPNKDEASVGLSGIELIDPATIKSPANVLL